MILTLSGYYQDNYQDNYQFCFYTDREFTVLYDTIKIKNHQTQMNTYVRTVRTHTEILKINYWLLRDSLIMILDFNISPKRITEWQKYVTFLEVLYRYFLDKTIMVWKHGLNNFDNCTTAVLVFSITFLVVHRLNPLKITGRKECWHMIDTKCYSTIMKSLLSYFNL